MKCRVWFLLFLALASCTRARPEALSCDEARVLQAQVGRESSPDEARAWASSTYQIPIEAVRLDPASSGAYLLTWRKQSLWYSLVVEDDHIGGISLSGFEAPAAMVMTCLGQPSVYHASYSWDQPGHNLSLELVFPASGALAHGDRFLKSARNSLRPSAMTYRCRCFASGNRERPTKYCTRSSLRVGEMPTRVLWRATSPGRTTGRTS